MQKTCSTVNGSPSIMVLPLDICMERERVFDKRQQGVKGKIEKAPPKDLPRCRKKMDSSRKKEREIFHIEKGCFPTFPTSFSKPNSTPFHLSFPPPQCLCLSFLLLLLILLSPSPSLQIFRLEYFLLVQLISPWRRRRRLWWLGWDMQKDYT